MLDQNNRTIDYLRLSVTDLCNLRCRYCMPSDGVRKQRHEDILSVDEIGQIVRAAAGCGIRKVRVTGGEPLVRKGILAICEDIAAIPGIGEVCLTTNGLLLPEYAKALREVGVSRLNISLDTLQPERYAHITRIGTLESMLRGLDAARAAGFTHTKMNIVLVGGFNDDEIADFVALTKNEDLQIRFIELMPLGACASWDAGCFIPADTVLRAVPGLMPIGSQGVAALYQIPGHRGTVGLIHPMSNHFCGTCNRVRVTADGKLKACLHSDEEIPLRGLGPEALRQAFADAIAHKPVSHHLGVTAPSQTTRAMNEIGG